MTAEVTVETVAARREELRALARRYSGHEEPRLRDLAAELLAELDRRDAADRGCRR